MERLLIILGLVGFYLAVEIICAVPVRLAAKHRSKKRIKSISSCEVCDKPALRLKQTVITGLLLSAELGIYDNYLCSVHATGKYKASTAHNLKYGWWSVRGIFRTPLYMYENKCYYNQLIKNTEQAIK
jgi:hypothetical protein